MIASRTSRQLLLALSATAICWLLCASPGQAQVGNAADLNFIARLNATIRKAVTKTRDPAGATQRFCEDICSSLLNIDVMMSTASADIYQQLSNSHRDLYRAGFLRRVIKDCASAATPYMSADVELAGIRSLASGERIIGTRSRAADADKIIMWQVRPDATGELTVTDVLVDGRSAMLSLREQATLSLERNPGDISALIQSLER